MAPVVTSRNPLQQPVNQIAPQTAVQNKPKQQQPLKKARRSSKPIINWFQRKLAGTVKSKRLSDGTHPQPICGNDAKHGATEESKRVSPSPSSETRATKQSNKPDAARRKTISLNGDEVKDLALTHLDDEGSMDSTSLALEATWSPISRMEADEDASVRPIPPSSPPSPSPSPSSSSCLSDPRTFGSIAASTKPTTLLSVDLTPNGVAHIAQVPATPISQISWFPPHVRTGSTSTNPVLGSGASVTFSALPPSLQSSRPLSLPSRTSTSLSTSPLTSFYANGPISSVQAPLHTTHHPRNNPRPSSPPSDNASLLTLASSAFAYPGSRAVIPGWSSAPPSAIGGDSLSHFGGSLHGEGYAYAESASQSVMGDYERLEERDVDASVRALRPRSSRRGSWDSETSDWSAREQGLGTSSFMRETSLRTTNSLRTGGHASGEEIDKQSNEPTGIRGPLEEAQNIAGSIDGDSKDQLPSPSAVGEPETIPTETRIVGAVDPSPVKVTPDAQDDSAISQEQQSEGCGLQVEPNGVANVSSMTS